MLFLTKILCPIDFSAASAEAVKKACELAKRSGAEICVLYVAPTLVPELVGAGSGSGGAASLDQARLEEFIARQGSKLVRVYGVLGQGDVVTEIGRIAVRDCADLVVMSTGDSRDHRASGVRSTAEAVATSSRCPVLVIRGEGKGSDGVTMLPWRTILCPTDFGEFCGAALRMANEQAHLFGGELHVLPLRIDAAPVTAVSWKLAEISGFPGPRDGILDIDAPASRVVALIAASARQHEADLIVVPSHGLIEDHPRNCGSITEKLLPLVNAPILVVPSDID